MGRKPHPSPVIVQDSGVLCHGVIKWSEQKGSINTSGLTTSLSDRKVDTVTCPRPQGPLKAQLCPLRSGMSLDFCKHLWIPHQQLLWLRKGTTATPVMDRQGGHQWAGAAWTCLRKKSKQTTKMVPSTISAFCYLSFYHHFVGTCYLCILYFSHVYTYVYTHTHMYLYMHTCVHVCMGFSGGAVVKNPPANAEDARNTGLIPGSGRSPGVGNSNHSSILGLPW